MNRVKSLCYQEPCQKKLSYGFNPPECEQIPVMILLVIHLKICYHTRMKSEGSLESLAIAPDPLNQRGPAWSASNTHKYTGNIVESQRPSDGISLLLTSQSSQTTLLA